MKEAVPPSSDRDDPLIEGDYDSHTFVIRIWLEDEELDSQPPLWRGHITHVLDYRRRYFQDVSGIVSYITPYLELWSSRRRTK